MSGAAFLARTPPPAPHHWEVFLAAITDGLHMVGKEYFDVFSAIYNGGAVVGPFYVHDGTPVAALRPFKTDLLGRTFHPTVECLRVVKLASDWRRKLV